MDLELKQARADLETRISRHVDQRFDTISHRVDERLETSPALLMSGWNLFPTTLRNASKIQKRNFSPRSIIGRKATNPVPMELLRSCISSRSVFGFVEERLNKLERGRNGQTNPGAQKS
jgi:hypothetical protein